jgi:hypothetical protein
VAPIHELPPTNLEKVTPIELLPKLGQTALNVLKWPFIAPLQLYVDRSLKSVSPNYQLSPATMTLLEWPPTERADLDA